jgi:hypothetical protein
VGYLRDDESQDLPDAVAARVRVIESGPSSARKEGVADSRGRLEVTDARGTSLLNMLFAESRLPLSRPEDLANP